MVYSYYSSLLLKLLVIIIIFLQQQFCFALSETSQVEGGGGGAQVEAISLLDFKTSISVDPSNLLSSWNLSSPPCTAPPSSTASWFAVDCDPFSGSSVIALRIPPRSRIVGSISPSLANLTHLRTLSLPHNLFSGPIPPQLAQLPALQTLKLQGNNLSGPIPPCLPPSLTLLNLSSNILSGPLPSSFASLSTVDVSNNQLSGTLTITSCEFLVHLKLSNNYFAGNIPHHDIAKCSRLRTLLLDGNIFQGRIPPQLGLLPELTILDVSRNCLVDRIPKELAHCKKLSILVLTNLAVVSSSDQGKGGEFNAFRGDIPYEVLSLPNIQVVWAPRANLGGRLPTSWTDTCSIRVVNLGQNYFKGVLPESLSLCHNLTFLDLSSNNLQGNLPSQLQVPCMAYFNISRNLFSGLVPRFQNSTSCDAGMISYEKDTNFLDEEDVGIAYSSIHTSWGSQAGTFGSVLDNHQQLAVHDFSRNRFFGPLPIFLFENKFYLRNGINTSYTLLLNHNEFNGSFPEVLFPDCDKLHQFSVNLSSNKISGALMPQLFLNCYQLTNFEAAQNLVSGLIPPEIGSSHMLQLIDLSNNMLSGALPEEIGNLKNLKWISLRANNLTGHISYQLGELTSLMVLDLSQNALSGPIPGSLANATSLLAVLLDHNTLSGEIPALFSTLNDLATLDLSYNNLSGHIPHLRLANDCNNFRGNIFLNPCPDIDSPPPTRLPVPMPIKHRHGRSKLKSFVIVMATSASIVFFVFLVVVLVVVVGKRKLGRLPSLRRKVMVTFAEAPMELKYEDVVRATGNFSISNVIGTGGFGSTYKAELVPGFLVAVKRLAIGRFQGKQQFDAEIRTLGSIRHKNLVTLVGYYVGESEMFLIYNYLSGGNLETFMHERSGKIVEWAVIHKIAYDIAKALSFLHYSCVPRIVHRDIKPSNILLDEDLNAYLSDFGLARLLEVSETHATTDVAGTFGYVAPEYAATCRVSDKSDVYSFGVVLLELMSGKKSLDPSFCEYGNGFNIVAWARLLISEERLSEVFSSRLWESGPRDNLLGMLRLASTCTAELLSVRPSMKQVLEKLKQLKP